LKAAAEKKNAPGLGEGTAHSAEAVKQAEDTAHEAKPY
jgi:hypothetical protein